MLLKAPRSNRVKLGRCSVRSQRTLACWATVIYFCIKCPYSMFRARFDYCYAMFPRLRRFLRGVKCGVEKRHEKTDNFVHLYSVVWSVAVFFFSNGKTNPQAALSFSAWLLILCMFIFNLSFVSLRCNPHRSSSLVRSFFSCVQLACFLCNIYNAALLSVPTG